MGVPAQPQNTPSAGPPGGPAIPGPTKPVGQLAPPKAEWIAYWTECRRAIEKFETLTERRYATGLTILTTIAAIGVVVVVAHIALSREALQPIAVVLGIALPLGVGVLYGLVRLDAKLMLGAIAGSIEAEHQMLPCKCVRRVGAACDIQQSPDCATHISCAIESKRSSIDQFFDLTVRFLILEVIAILVGGSLIYVAIFG